MKHAHVKVVALQPATYSGRYDLRPGPLTASRSPTWSKPSPLRSASRTTRTTSSHPLQPSQLRLAHPLRPPLRPDPQHHPTRRPRPRHGKVANKTLLNTGELRQVVGRQDSVSPASAPHRPPPHPLHRRVRHRHQAVHGPRSTTIRTASPPAATTSSTPKAGPSPSANTTRVCGRATPGSRFRGSARPEDRGPPRRPRRAGPCPLLRFRRQRARPAGGGAHLRLALDTPPRLSHRPLRSRPSVAARAWLGLPCPLTWLEDHLRANSAGDRSVLVRASACRGLPGGGPGTIPVRGDPVGAR